MTPPQRPSRRPIIGLTPVYKRKQDTDVYHCRLDIRYIRCVEQAGGVPLILPLTKGRAFLRDTLPLLDGLILTGGDDLPPESYGESVHPHTRPMEPERFAFESELIRQWLRTNRPTLGICLGIQFVNVLLGGTLWQDIPTDLPHAQPHRQEGKGDALIEVAIGPDTRLRKVLRGNRFIVAASHHQAVRNLGRGLVPAACSDDGIIMAAETEDPGRYLLLVQWHPERLEEDRYTRRLFRSLVQAAGAVADRH